jgi:hypothetical protein
MLNFNEWQATRREVADLGAEVGAEYWETGANEPFAQSGYMYEGGYYIETDGDRCFLTIFNESYSSNKAGIAPLERQLYSLYASENA